MAAAGARVGSTNADVQFLDKILLNRRQIQGILVKLAQQIDMAHGLATRAQDDTEELVLLGVLKAALYFTCDLSRELAIPNRAEFVRYRSYEHDVQGTGRFLMPALELADIARQIEGHHVLIVDTICDTGETLSVVSSIIAGYEPASLETCVLVLRAGANFTPTYTGALLENDAFLYGYGLDLDEGRRHLPCISEV